MSMQASPGTGSPSPPCPGVEKIEKETRRLPEGPSPAVAQTTRSLLDPTAEKPPLFSHTPNTQPKTRPKVRDAIAPPTCAAGQSSSLLKSLPNT